MARLGRALPIQPRLWHGAAPTARVILVPVATATASAPVPTPAVVISAPVATATAAAATPLFGTAYNLAVLTDTPVGYWRLNEASGTTVLDASSVASNGTYVASPTLAATGATTRTGTGVTFASASSQYANLGSASQHDVGDVFSVEAFFKSSDSAAAAHTILSAGLATGSSAGFQVRVSFGVVQITRFTFGASVISTIGVADGAWHHIICTKNGATQKIWIDGVDRTGTITNKTCVSTGFMTIGAAWNVSSYADFANATIDEVSLYNYELNSTQVAAHWAATPPAAGRTIQPPVATATASAPAPSLTLSVQPAAATATSSAATPSVTEVLAVPVATSTAAAPVATLKAVILPAAATSTASAPVPSILKGKTIAPPVATAAAAAPTPAAQAKLLPAAATATSSAAVPTLRATILPAAATSTASGVVPTPRATIQITLATATASAPVPTVISGGRIIPAPVATATSSALLPSVPVILKPPVALAAASAPLPAGRAAILPGVAAATALAAVPVIINTSAPPRLPIAPPLVGQYV